MESYIKYYSDLKVNFVKIEQNNLPSNLNDAYEKRKNFNANTILYNDFTSMLDAFYFSPHSEFSSNFCSIYRKTPSQPYYNYVCTLNGEIALRDYNIHNHDNYEYMAVIGIGQSDGSYTYQIYDNRGDEGEKILTYVDWDNWSIYNIEELESTPDNNIYVKTGNTWLLGLNLEGENLTQNMSASALDTLGKYPRVYMGSKNYESSTFTGLLGNMKDVYTVKVKPCSQDEKTEVVYRYTERINIKDKYGREVEKYRAWKEFCNDGELKLLKDVKGNSWIVHIIDNPTNSISNNSYSMPTTISFSWKEVLNVEDISIIEKEE